MINSEQFRELIIKPTLSKLQLYSNEAEELMVFTCAVESNGGHFLAQVNGPALGIFQMEPATYNDIWQNFIRHRPQILSMLTLHFACGRMPDENRLIYDLEFATAMARIHYLRVKKPIPLVGDTSGLWDYYKEFFNTGNGKAKKDPSLAKYEAFIKQ